MLDLSRILLDGGLLAIVGGIYILAVVAFNPRLILNEGDLPPDILAAVPPKTEKEKRLAFILGTPFLIGIIAVPLVSTLQFRQQAGGDVAFLSLFLHPFFVLMIFNLFDLLVLDLLLLCTITPRFMVVPGTEGFAGYKDYSFHIKQHVRSLPFQALSTLLIAVIVSVL